MPRETNTDKISKLEQLTAALQERADNQNEAIKDLNASRSDGSKDLHGIDKRLAVLERDVSRVEKRFDELLSRRFKIGTLILAAVLGAVLTSVASVGIRYLEHVSLTNTSPA